MIKGAIRKRESSNLGFWRNEDTGELKDLEQIALDLRLVSNGNGDVLSIYNQSLFESNTDKRLKGWAMHKHKIESENKIKDNFGNYVHYIYVRTPSDMNKKFKVYMLKMSTSLNYNDKYIYLGSKNDPNRILVKKDTDLMKVLDIKSRTAYANIKNALKSSNILGRDKIGYYINPNIVLNGDIKLRAGYTRVMIEGFNELYIAEKDKTTLGYFLELIPFINKENNILCHNPWEKELEKIIPMPLSDIANILGVAQNNSIRLRNRLLKLKIKGMSTFGIFNRGDVKIFVVNPHLYYSGSGAGIDYLKGLFGINN